MRTKYEIENIEDMRRREGIEDVELWEDIRALAIGDVVKVTFLTMTPVATETLQVRITSIRGKNFEGALAERPTSTALVKLRLGTSLSFTAGHIHSIPNKSSRTGRQRFKEEVRP